ncbi:MAG: gspD 1 [Chthoniobacteraceae bacterium]|nr:gspD 1 [Chthoniobacteraceae bacterium]
MLYPFSKMQVLGAMLVPALLAFSAQAQAQSARSGAAGGGGVRAGTTTRNTGSTSSGSSNSATGPRQYRSNTLLGDATIQVDPETRSLIVVTDEETHDQLFKVIRTLDKPKPQVLIKVVFIEVTYNKGSDIGVEGSYAFNLKNPTKAITGTSTTTTSTGNVVNATTGVTTSTNTSLVSDIGTVAGLGNSATASSLFGLAQATDGSFLRVVGDDWQATLRLLATRGKLEVLSRPSIMARNNQEAVIVVGQEVPFVTNSRVTSDGQTINTIQYDNVGIILRVTPFITSEGTVEMIVAPEISTLTSQTVPISNTASAPVIAKRSAETVVVTPNAQTVVIGGLMETQKTEAVRKIPILGDIPILGLPFKRTVKDSVKRELMIFLTPYIVNNPKGLKDLTAIEAEEAELVHKAFTDKELAKFVDLPKLDPLPVRTKEVTTTTVKAPLKEPEVRRAVRLENATK